MKHLFILTAILDIIPHNVLSCGATGGGGNPIADTPCTNEQVAVRLDVDDAKAFDEKTVTGDTMRLVCDPLDAGGVSGIEVFSNAGDPAGAGTSPALDADNSITLTCLNGVWTIGGVTVVEASCQASPVEAVQCTNEQVDERLDIADSKAFDEKTVTGDTMRLVCNPLDAGGTSGIEVFSNAGDPAGAGTSPPMEADNSITLTCVDGAWMIGGVTVVEASCQASPVEAVQCTNEQVAERLDIDDSKAFDEKTVTGDTMRLVCNPLDAGGTSGIEVFSNAGDPAGAGASPPLEADNSITLTCANGVWMIGGVTVVEASCQASPVETPCTNDQVGVRMDLQHAKAFTEKTVDGDMMRLVCDPYPVPPGADSGTPTIQVFSTAGEATGTFPTMAADNSVTLTCVAGAWTIDGVTVVEAACQARCGDILERLTGEAGVKPFDSITVNGDMLTLTCSPPAGALAAEIQLFPNVGDPVGPTPPLDAENSLTLTCMMGLWRFDPVTAVEAVCQFFD